MMPILFKAIALTGFVSCLFAAAEVGSLANYYARVEDRSRDWCRTTSYCASVRRGGSLAAPVMFVQVQGNKAPKDAGVVAAMQAAGALVAPRRDEDPAPRVMEVVVGRRAWESAAKGARP